VKNFIVHLHTEEPR